MCVCACMYVVCIEAMHRIFQQDLLRLRLETARSYAKAISASLVPITSSEETESLKITAQVRWEGVGWGGVELE